MIKTLSLTNFRKHEKLHLDFTAGLNGIFGPNYRGKSTVLYGVLFALGGIRAIPCSTVLREGATTYKVDLTFTADDDYRVVRTKSTDRLYKGLVDSDENLIANGTTVVNKKIEEILGMTMKRFLQTRFAQQKKTHAILLTGANELYAVINEISGADTVEAGLKKLADKAKYLDGFLDQVEMPDVATKQAELDETTLEIITKGTEVTMWNDMLAQNKSELDTAKIQLGLLRQDERDLQTYESDMRHAEEDFRKATQHLANTEESAIAVAPDLAEKAAEIKTDIDTLSTTLTEVSGITMLLEAQRKDMTELLRSLEDAQKKKAALVPAIDPQVDLELLAEYETELANKKSELAVINAELKTLESELLEPKCSKCGRAWEDHEAKKLHHDQAVEAATNLKRKLQETILGLETDIENDSRSLQIYADANDAYIRTFDSCQQLINGFKAREATASESLTANEIRLKDLCPEGRDALVFKRTDLEGQLTEMQRVLRRHEQDLQDIQRAKEREKEANEKLQEVVKRTRPEFKAGDLELAVNAERALSDSYTQASTAHATATTQLKALEERHTFLKLSLPEMQERADKITKAEGQRSVNKNLTKFLKSNRDRYMADIWTVLMAQASQFVQECTSGAIEAIARTDDGDFTYTEEGRTLPISEASGAQASIMGLAVQLALSSAVQPPLDVLLVDEPNADMDPEHSMAVNLLLSATVGQVICVSHSHMDSSVCENVIEL